MKLAKLDHVNVRTANLDTMVDWYCKVLGMANGKRPPFRFPGAWLYAGDAALVHLVGVDADPANVAPKIEHFALTATGLGAFVKRLNEDQIAFEASRVPGSGILQVNVHDCDGNHIHIDFSSSEADAAGF